MKELEILLNRRWILKSEDKELYITGSGMQSGRSGNM